MKYDGFRALAVIERGGAQLISRNGTPFASFSALAESISDSLPNARAVIDGEICSLDRRGRPQFKNLANQCSDCGSGICESHTETCDICHDFFCPSLNFLSQTSAARDFQEVGWEEVCGFIRKHEGASPDEKERAAGAARLTARIATEGRGRLAIVPKAINAVFYLAGWTGASILARSPLLSDVAVAIVSGIGGYTRGTVPGDWVGELIQEGLYKKYLGLIDGAVLCPELS